MSRKITALRAERRWPGALCVADTQLADLLSPPSTRHGAPDCYFREVHSVTVDGQYLHAGGLALAIDEAPIYYGRNGISYVTSYRILARWHHDVGVWVRDTFNFRHAAMLPLPPSDWPTRAMAPDLNCSWPFEPKGTPFASSIATRRPAVRQAWINASIASFERGGGSSRMIRSDRVELTALADLVGVDRRTKSRDDE